MIRKEYCNQRNILNVELSGKVGLAEILEYYEEIASDDNLPRSLRIIEDATDAEFDFCIDDVKWINDTIVKFIGNFHCIKHALLSYRPLETAYGIMRDHTNNIDDYLTKVFTTENGAIGWLLND